MASGKLHQRASLLLSPVGAALAGVVGGAATGDVGWAITAALGGLVGSPSGAFIGPDNDQIGTAEGEWDLIRALGPLGFLWQACWWPYVKLVGLAGGHRSPLSHTPLLSTAVRLLYVAAPFLAVGYYFYWDYAAWPWWVWPLLAGWVVSLALSDLAHWVMDFVWAPRKARKSKLSSREVPRAGYGARPLRLW
jgi:uncharacterized metal-binding protein